MPINCRIGRQRDRVRGIAPEPVYRLQWRNPGPNQQSETYATVTLRWVSRKGEGEKLELVKAAPADGFQPVMTEEVELKLNTMMEHSFWLDDPKLNIRQALGSV